MLSFGDAASNKAAKVSAQGGGKQEDRFKVTAKVQSALQGEYRIT